jgi:hypothetical protein
MHISCVFRVVTEPTSSASLTWFICQMDPYVSWVGSLNEIPVLLGVLANKDGVISIHGLDKTAKPRNRETAKPRNRETAKPRNRVSRKRFKALPP